MPAVHKLCVWTAGNNCNSVLPITNFYCAVTINSNLVDRTFFVITAKKKINP